jgi:Mg2+/Co2+ transporter CorB
MIIAVSDPALPVLIGLLALCLALSAFFSGTETALMSFNRYQLRTMANQGHRGAILAERLLQRPDRLIGLILLGNNLANNLAATLVAIIVLRTYGEEWVAVGAGVLTLVMLIFCEVGPKTYAAIHPRRLATTSSYAYIGLQWLLRPAVYAVNWITNGALRLVGLNVDRQTQQNTLSREELRTVVAEAGLMIPRSHQQMLIGILDLERITVNDIMIPRQDISGIDLDDDWERILDQLRQTPHTRLPVYRGDMGNMVGLLHMKRVAQELARGSLDRERLGEVAVQREPYYVPEGTPLTTQLQNFQRDRRRLAFVVDEYGEVMGLVTLEDILEEIVGEFTQNAASLSQRDIHRDRSGAYIINGGTTIRTLNRTLGWQLPTDGPKTLNGLLIERLETIPSSGTSLRIDNLEMEVLQVADNTVRTVKVRVTSESSAEGDRESLR